VPILSRRNDRFGIARTGQEAVMRARLLFAAALFALLAPAAHAGPVYLALGDSSAFGETDRTRNPSNGDRGYVAPFADFLGVARYPTRPTVVNLGINGETTVSWSDGPRGRVSSDGIFLNSNYARFAPDYPTQQERFRQVVADAKARGDRIGTVTVQLGANDPFLVVARPDFFGLDPSVQMALIGGQLGTLRQNYAAILSEVRGALPDAELYVMGYHNPYGGRPDHPLAPLADPVVQAVNGIAAEIAPQFGGTHVSFYDVIKGREKELTLIERDDELNNVHLNEAGYAVAGAELVRVASANTPEPGTLLLCAVGVLGVGGYRGLRRAAR
jgi:lysophospholipase L1-like esterase